jgi:hypothetical protein
MIDPSEGEQAERVFRTFKEKRDVLKRALLALKEPLRILDLKRRFEEQQQHAASLGSVDNVSIRLHSMKIGREELMDDLWELTKPIPLPPEPTEQADYQPENEQS